MTVGPLESDDWRNSLHSLISPQGLLFIYSQQFSGPTGRHTSLDDREERSVRRAAEGGHGVAMEKIGIDLLSREPEANSLNLGLDWLRRAVEVNNPVAMITLAEHLLARAKREAGFEALKEARNLLHRAMSSGFLSAQVLLGAHFMDGDAELDGDAESDHLVGLKLLRSAAASGSRLAHLVLAACHIGGCGVSRDSDVGVGWLGRLGATTAEEIGGLAGYVHTKAARSSPYQRRLLLKYAAILFAEAARRGSQNDEVNLAYLIRRGEAFGSELPSLDSLLKAGIEQKHSHAMMNQALRLAQGIGCTENWHAADDMVAGIGDISTLASWWSTLELEHDAEGHLVLGWLARHKRTAEHAATSMSSRFDVARTAGWRVPDWMYSVAS